MQRLSPEVMRATIEEMKSTTVTNRAVGIDYDDPVEVPAFTVKRVEHRYMRFGIPMRYADVTMDSLFKGDIGPTRPALEEVRVYASNMGKHLVDGVGAILSGDVGTGKTSAAIAIMVDFLDKGGNAFFVPCTDLVDAFYTMPQAQRIEFERKVRTVPLLVIDDFGAELPKDWVANKIESIITDRYNGLKPTIITTNLKQKELKDTYSRRLFDRLKASCAFIALKGTSLRDPVKLEVEEEIPF